jgi:hypothetical protein
LINYVKPKSKKSAETRSKFHISFLLRPVFLTPWKLGGLDTYHVEDRWGIWKKQHVKDEISWRRCSMSSVNKPNEILWPFGTSWQGICPLAGCLEDGNGNLHFVNVYVWLTTWEAVRFKWPILFRVG